MDKEVFVQNIKKQCSLRGVKPTIACRESGAGADLINQIERRGSVPSVERVQLLAQYLGVTVSELLGEPLPEEQARAALTAHLAQSVKDHIVEDSKIVLSQTASLVASAYDKADEGTQAAVRKLLDVEAVPQESGHTSEAM
ncbi:helix-turn-helix domain-containing protein [uncultured Oscillibacter sp.]|uniref:helix-turn-helix domain-containing protein n=1 Tax=uncultured Oscillibacter sp. TaxID=876091 RepID=UPI002614009F|nr:helix-turn-helix transcriptional regulator [uncultured Oscillibacter sp.]